VGTIETRIVLEPDTELSAERIDRLTRRLRAQIAALDVDTVAFAPADGVPPGAKPGDAVTIGTLLVTMSASGGVFVGLVELLRGWLDSTTGRHRVSVTVEGDTIELDRATSEQQRQLVEAFIRRHAED
jgi:hypothetical protein